MAGDAKTIGRRNFAGALATFGLLALTGCNGSSAPSAESELAALEGAISTLTSTVERFKNDDWKDVVPDVEPDASDVATAFANLKAAMGKQ